MGSLPLYTVEPSPSHIRCQGEIPRKMGVPNPLFRIVFLGREYFAKFGTRPCQTPLRFGILLYFLHTTSPLKKKTQHTRKHRKLNVPKSAFTGDLCSPLRGRQDTPENATHPKAQMFGPASYFRFRVCCVFGCVLAPAYESLNEFETRSLNCKH